ncbi:Protein O-mannosyl-transferase tmtc2 [Chamberlinius hualienensis]
MFFEKTNQDLLSSSPVSNLFTNDFWGTPLTHSGSHKSYRPLCVLSFRFNYYLGQLDPWGYHLGNVILHAIVTAVFTHLARTFLRYTFPTFVAGLLFASHPIHTEAVAGIVGRADVGACLFFLISLLCYIKYCKCRDKAGLDVRVYHCRWLYLAIGLVSATCSMLTKEHGITVLAVCACYDVIIHVKLKPKEILAVIFEKRYRCLLEGLMSLASMLIVIISYRVHLMGSKPPDFAPADNPAADSDSFLTRTLTFFYLPTFNFWLLLYPRWLSFDWSMGAIPLITSPLDFRNVFTVVFYLAFVHLVAERVLYIPSMGFCLLIALGVQILYRHFQSQTKKRLLVCAIGVLVAVFCMRTVVRNRDWLTEERLYRSGIPVNPPKAFGNLANILSAQGKKDEAEWAYKKALRYRSNMADVHYNLGILLQEQKRYEETLQSYRLAIQFRPRMAMAHLNLGLVLGILGRKDEAAEVYRHCSLLDGTGLKDPKMHENTKISALFNLGRLYADDGKYEEAIEVYKEAVSKMPPHYQPQSLYNMLGEAYFKLEKYTEAEYWYKEALKAKPDHIPAHLTYGKMLSKLQNRVDEAEQWFNRAKLLAPNDSSVYQHYGQFLSETDRHAEAAVHYVRAAELAPDEYEIIFNAANTLRQAGQNEEAEKYYRIAVKLRPNEAISHMNLGAMLHVNGKLKEAELSYLEALRLKPDDAITQNNLQKLRNLLSKRGIRSSSSGHQLQESLR